MAALVTFHRGWIQKLAAHTYEEGELRDALNVVPDGQGAILTRLGHTLVNSTSQSDVHSLFSTYSDLGVLIRYQGAGTALYRNFVSIVTGLSGVPLAFVSARSFGEQKVYTFFAGGTNGQPALRVKDDGIAVSRWGLNPPFAAPSQATGGTGALSGTYAWRQVYLRKPLIPSVYGRYTAGTNTYTLAAAGPITLTTVLASDGLAIGGTRPFSEIVFALTGAASVGGVYDYAYWQGTVWAPFTPDVFPVYTSTGITNVRWSFPVGSWVPDAAGQYVIRIRGTTPPGTSAIVNTFRLYDSVISAQSNASPPSQEVVVSAAPTYGRWDASTATYALGAFGPITLTTGVTNDGVIVGGIRPSRKMIVTVTGVAAAGATYDYSYWNGTVWVGFALTTTPDYMTLGDTAAEWAVPLAGWVPDVYGFYSIRIRGTVPPGTSAILAAFRLYDSLSGADLGGATGRIVTLTNPLIPGTIDYDPQITHSALYRTRGDDPAWISGAGLENALFYFEMEVPAEMTVQNSIMDDDRLNELLEIDNDRPPAFSTITYHQNRVWGAVGNRLYPSKPDMPESFSPASYVPVSVPGDPIRRIAQFDGNLYVWTAARVFLVLGTDELSYVARQIQCPTGLGAFNTVDQGAKGVYFLGSDGNLWLLQGTTVAINVSQDDHYQFFHSLTLHGILSLNQAARDVCVGVWAYSRYYLSYPQGTDVFPTASLFVDESDGTWWRDTRAWRAMTYDRQANDLYGSNQGGGVFLLESGDTDNGAAFSWRVQTRDDDEGAPESTQTLVQLTVDADTQDTPLTVLLVRDFGSLSANSLGTVTTGQREQQILTAGLPDLLRAKAFGYVLSGLAPMVVYRLIPQVRRAPPDMKAWMSLWSTMGYAGPKLLESLLLDVDLISGTLTCQVYGNQALVETFVLTASGRTVSQVITHPHEADVFQFVITGTGTFALYESSVVGWRPLAAPIYNDALIPSGLDSSQQKIGLSYSQDIELLDEGTLTVRFLADGTEIHRIIYDTPGRHRTDRLRLPAEMRGRLLEVRRQSTVEYRLWESTVLEVQDVGAPRPRDVRFVADTYGQFTRTPLLSLVQQGS